MVYAGTAFSFLAVLTRKTVMELNVEGTASNFYSLRVRISEAEGGGILLKLHFLRIPPKCSIGASDV